MVSDSEIDRMQEEAEADYEHWLNELRCQEYAAALAYETDADAEPALTWELLPDAWYDRQWEPPF